MREEKGRKRGRLQYKKQKKRKKERKGDLIINIRVDVKMGKLCLPPGPPAGLMVSTNFP